MLGSASQFVTAKLRLAGARVQLYRGMVWQGKRDCGLLRQDEPSSSFPCPHALNIKGPALGAAAEVERLCPTGLLELGASSLSCSHCDGRESSRISHARGTSDLKAGGQAAVSVPEPDCQHTLSHLSFPSARLFVALFTHCPWVAFGPFLGVPLSKFDWLPRALSVLDWSCPPSHPTDQAEAPFTSGAAALQLQMAQPASLVACPGLLRKPRSAQ